MTEAVPYSESERVFMIIKETKYKSIRKLLLTGDGTYSNVLNELGEYALANHLANTGYPNALLDREEAFPTGIMASVGIAIPHTGQEFTKEGTIVISILEKEAVFKSMGSFKPVDVKVIFQLLLNKPENQVKMLGKIVDYIQDSAKMKQLIDEIQLEELYEDFGQYV